LRSERNATSNEHKEEQDNEVEKNDEEEDTEDNGKESEKEEENNSIDSNESNVDKNTNKTDHEKKQNVKRSNKNNIHDMDVEDGSNEDNMSSLIERYTKMAAKNTKFAVKKNSWYTLKFNTLKESSAANYYLVQMEFSNNNDDEQLNIWLKGSFVHDVLKIIAEYELQSKSLFNGFKDVIINGALCELRLKPYGDNICHGNKKGGVTYKEYINYYLIPKKFGTQKKVVEQFKTTMVKLLQSNQFFGMMTVYQNERNNQGGQPGNVLRDLTSDVWSQLKTTNNSKLSYIDALNAKFMDNEINVILMHLFGESSNEAKYQKIGWNNYGTNPWKKSKKI
jgi:hypothetical protein